MCNDREPNPERAPPGTIASHIIIYISGSRLWLLPPAVENHSRLPTRLCRSRHSAFFVSILGHEKGRPSTGTGRRGPELEKNAAAGHPAFSEGPSAAASLESSEPTRSSIHLDRRKADGSEWRAHILIKRCRFNETPDLTSLSLRIPSNQGGRGGRRRHRSSSSKKQQRRLASTRRHDRVDSRRRGVCSVRAARIDRSIDRFGLIRSVRIDEAKSTRPSAGPPLEQGACRPRPGFFLLAAACRGRVISNSNCSSDGRSSLPLLHCLSAATTVRAATPAGAAAAPAAATAGVSTAPASGLCLSGQQQQQQQPGCLVIRSGVGTDSGGRRECHKAACAGPVSGGPNGGGRRLGGGGDAVGLHPALRRGSVKR